METLKTQHKAALKFNWNAFLISVEEGIRSLFKLILAFIEFILSGAKFVLEAGHLCVTAAKNKIEDLPQMPPLVEAEFESEYPQIPIEITNP